MTNYDENSMVKNEAGQEKLNTGGGLYRNVTVSVKVLTVTIIVGMIALIATVVFLSTRGGYTVSFNAGEENKIVSQKLKYGETVQFPIVPQKAGYKFDGWYTDETYTSKWNFETDTVEKNMVLYAKWKPEDLGKQ